MRVGPKFFAQCYACDYTPGLLEQQLQDAKGFLFKTHEHSVLPQFAGLEIHFKHAESHNRFGVLYFVHGEDLVSLGTYFRGKSCQSRAVQP
jgi:hypothetical protein